MKIKNDQLVSIIVNCFNGQLYLKRALKSIKSQVYKKYEVIFIDNCSNDDSAKIFNQFQMADKRFKYFKTNENVKLGEARKFGVEKCNGKFISFLDVDDIWLPNKLKYQISLMEKNNSDISYSSYYEFRDIDDIENNSAKLIKPSLDEKKCFIKNLNVFQVSLPTLTIRKSALKLYNLNFDSNIFVSEEFCLVMQLLSYNVKVTIIDKPLVGYMISDDSLSVTGMKYWSLDRRYTLDKIRKNNPFLKINYKNQFREAYYKADYYEALYLYVNGKEYEARSLLKNAALHNYKYLIIFILFHPYLKFLFKFILKLKYKRNFKFKKK